MNEDNCREILEALPSYITVLDRELNVLWSNAAAQRDFGPFHGKKCNEYYNIDRFRCDECPVMKSFNDGGVHSIEKTVQKSDGSTMNLLLHTAATQNSHGAITRVVETGIDITPAKDIQSQLILLGETVARMAHSIKNIMMGLEGGIYVVNKGIESDDWEEVQEGWEMVIYNFDKISHIVKDILYCSKPREPELKPVDPQKVLREVYDLFKTAASKYGVELTLTIEEGLGENMMDPEGLHTVVSNLVSNAIDACKMDMWQESHTVELKGKQGSDGSTIIEVRDDGVGMGAELKEHIFEDFFSSKGDQGTGLGLMVTQKIVREHGGRITFRSEKGAGTTFTLIFPKRDRAE
jgi:signal transduction histidine kinase